MLAYLALLLVTNDCYVQGHLAESSAYKPQVEAISPTLPVDNALENQIRHSRDELVQNIHRVDREITNMDHTVEKLKRKQVGVFSQSPCPKGNVTWCMQVIHCTFYPLETQ